MRLQYGSRLDQPWIPNSLVRRGALRASSEGAMTRRAAVSVLMTAYNRAQFIGASIESVLAQTFTDFELLIVDD